MGTVSLVGATMLLAIWGQILGFYDFTKRPTIPFEATTFEQDALVEEAEKMRGDNKEVEPVIACDGLIADKTAPFELRSWAVRQKIKLCTYARREWEALEAGKAWLKSEGDDDSHALDIRIVMGQIIAHRGHDNFIPMYEDAKAVFDDLFKHCPPDNEFFVRAHLNYRDFMYKRMRVYPELYDEISANALVVLEDALEKNRVATTFRPHLEMILADMKREHAWRLQAKEPPKPQMTEKEYLEERRQWAENVRLLRQYRIEKGLLDPNGPPQSEEYSSGDFETPEFLEFREKVKKERCEKKNSP